MRLFVGQSRKEFRNVLTLEIMPNLSNLATNFKKCNLLLQIWYFWEVFLTLTSSFYMPSMLTSPSLESHFPPKKTGERKNSQVSGYIEFPRRPTQPSNLNHRHLNSWHFFWFFLKVCFLIKIFIFVVFFLWRVNGRKDSAKWCLGGDMGTTGIHWHYPLTPTQPILGTGVRGCKTAFLAVLRICFSSMEPIEIFFSDYNKISNFGNFEIENPLRRR